MPPHWPPHVQGAAALLLLIAGTFLLHHRLYSQVGGCRGRGGRGTGSRRRLRGRIPRRACARGNAAGVAAAVQRAHLNISEYRFRLQGSKAGSPLEEHHNQAQVRLRGCT